MNLIFINILSMKLMLETAVQGHERELPGLCFIMKVAIQNSLKNCPLHQEYKIYVCLPRVVKYKYEAGMKLFVIKNQNIIFIYIYTTSYDLLNQQNS